MARRAKSILSLPRQLVRWVIHDSRSRDWWAAAPALSTLGIMIVLFAFSLDPARFPWVATIVWHIALWPLWELIALVVTPVLLWWFDAEEPMPVRRRVLVSLAIFAFWYAVTWATNFILLGYIGLFALVRMLPMFVHPRPGPIDREKELVKLAFIVFFALFFMAPAYMLFDMAAQRFSWDTRRHEDVIFLAFSALYFFYLAGIELLFNDYRKRIG